MEMVDLFSGAGGTSTGAAQAARACGVDLKLTAVNHWDRAIETHTFNHPTVRHYCEDASRLNPLTVFPGGKIELLWGSPECTHHSRASGNRPKNDQSRATAWCVTRWAEQLQPEVVWVENVVEFKEWGPLDEKDQPDKSRKGALFQVWLEAFRALGYTVEWRELVAADYGDPTIRKRLIVQAVRPGRELVWPVPTHSREATSDKLPWPKFYDYVNWTHGSQSIFQRRKRLVDATQRRIGVGLARYGLQAFLIPQQAGHRCRSLELPLPTLTVRCADALAQPFLIKYYGTGVAAPLDEPLDTVTTKARFGLIEMELQTPPAILSRLVIDSDYKALLDAFNDHQDGRSTGRLSVVRYGSPPCKGLLLETEDGEYLFDVHYRMLQPDELAAGSGFPDNYGFQGTQAEIYKQIGNAVPPGLSRALVAAQLQKLQ